jgi:prolyl 4-hydroxylase
MAKAWNRSFVGMIATGLLAFVLIFGAILYYLSGKVNNLTLGPDRAFDIVDTSGTKIYGDLRRVTILNYFPESVSLYFQDNDAGVYITTIQSQEKADIRAANNHIFFATTESSPDRLASVTVRDGMKEFYLVPSRRLPVPRNDHVKYQLDAKETSRLHPQVALTHARSFAMAVKFKSLSSRMMDLWFDDGGAGIWEGHLRMGQETTTNTYVGHVFIVTLTSDKHTEIVRFRMHADQVTYVIYDEGHPASQAILDQNAQEDAFTSGYFNTTGIHWRHYYGPSGPRAPPKLFMWPADKVGQVHTVSSPEGQWQCNGDAQRCKSTAPVELELEVVSIAPRAFIIPNFLSDFEADHIINSAKPHIATSSVGDADVGVQTSDTRTSKNTWIHRYSTEITKSIFLRVADVLALDESLLIPKHNAEDLQVVHYENGQKYDPHHDWGVSGKPESRLITLLLYLTDQESLHAGGETAFPKGNEGWGFKVRPKKGHAVLFYNLLEDGNGDDLSLHASLPTVAGEKWLSNVWVWDPHFH